MASRAARRAEWVALAIVVLLAAVFVAPSLLVRSPWVVDRVRSELLPRFSQKLGREIRFGRMEARLFPSARVVLHDVEVAGGPGEPPLATAREVQLQPRVWPLVRSLGRDFELTAVRVEGARLALVERRDGTWSVEDLGPFDTTSMWSLSELQIRDLELRVIALASGGEIVVPGISVDTGEIAYGQPLQVRVRAAAGQVPGDIAADIRLSTLPRGFKQLGPDKWPSLSGSVQLAKAPVSLVRELLPSGMANLFTGGKVSLDAKLETGRDGMWTARGPLKLEELSMRGHPASGAAELSLAFPPWKPKDFTLDLAKLNIGGPGIAVAGTARALGAPRRVDLDLDADQLDLDVLLAALPEKGQGGAGSAGTSELLPDSLRAQLGRIDVHGTLRAKKIARGPLTATGLVAKLTLTEGVLRLDEATAGFFGGRVDLAGTTLDVREGEPTWMLKAALANVNLSDAFAAVHRVPPIRGSAGGQLSLRGSGNDWAKLRQTLAGEGALDITGGAIPGVDLVAELAGPVGRALGGATAEALQRAGEGTSFRDVHTRFAVEEGAMRLSRPLTFRSEGVSVSLDGRIGLDLRLDLDGQALLEPGLVSQLSAGKARPAAAVPVPLHVGGTLEKPQIGAGSPGHIAEGLLREKIGGTVQDLLKRQGRKPSSR